MQAPQYTPTMRLGAPLLNPNSVQYNKSTLKRIDELNKRRDDNILSIL